MVLMSYAIIIIYCQIEFIRRIFVDIRAELLGPMGKPGLEHKFIILTKRPQECLNYGKRIVRR